MRMTRAVVPTLFTVLNMFSGFLSIIHSNQGAYVEACYFILLAGVFDTLDGFMARLTKSSSEFGIEIDSLSDVVSFGAAPSFLVYTLYLHSFGSLGIIISSLIVILGGIRLARFNVQLIGYDKEFFTGLPIPAAAIAVVTYVLTFIIEGNRVEGLSADLLAPFVIIVSLLMVSKIKYDAFPKLSLKDIKKHPVRSISFFFSGLLIIFTKGAAIFYVFTAFILFGVLRAFIGLFRKVKPDQALEESPSYDI